MITRRSTLGLLAAASAAPLVAPSAAFAMEPSVFQRRGVAIRGADAVAFFDLPEASGPVLGTEEYSHQWRGAVWHFASAGNRDTFAANPEAYAPAYGGYCAFAAARGYVAGTVPEAWSLVDGRLFLNYSRRIRRRWLRELPDAIQRADARWPGLVG